MHNLIPRAIGASYELNINTDVCQGVRKEMEREENGRRTRHFRFRFIDNALQSHISCSWTRKYLWTRGTYMIFTLSLEISRGFTCSSVTCINWTLECQWGGKLLFIESESIVHVNPTIFVIISWELVTRITAKLYNTSLWWAWFIILHHLAYFMFYFCYYWCEVCTLSVIIGVVIINISWFNGNIVCKVICNSLWRYSK